MLERGYLENRYFKLENHTKGFMRLCVNNEKKSLYFTYQQYYYSNIFLIELYFYLF